MIYSQIETLFLEFKLFLLHYLHTKYEADCALFFPRPKIIYEGKNHIT